MGKRSGTSAPRGAGRTGGLEVGKRMEHGGGPVEVGGQSAAAVAVQQRAEAELQLSGQVRGDDVLGADSRSGRNTVDVSARE